MNSSISSPNVVGTLVLNINYGNCVEETFFNMSKGTLEETVESWEEVWRIVAYMERTWWKARRRKVNYYSSLKTFKKRN